LSTDLSIVTLVLEATLPVQLVMAILVLASFISWTMIFRKYFVLGRASRAANTFEDQFWSGIDLVEVFNRIDVRRSGANGMERIFHAGFKEFARLRGQKTAEARDILSGTERAMRIALGREVEYLETGLSFLATVGSTSPYIGLLGTVWGIMNSFRALGNVQQATIAMVAPGIAEALIATAMGLFAAIPAVIAYNRFSHDVERIHNRYDAFVDEFSTILQRQAHQ